jgi:hypothetical protein
MAMGELGAWIRLILLFYECNQLMQNVTPEFKRYADATGSSLYPCRPPPYRVDGVLAMPQESRNTLGTAYLDGSPEKTASIERARLLVHMRARG